MLVVGVGNELRGDDGLGVHVVRWLSERAVSPGISVREQQGEPVGLLELWQGADGAVLVDAVRSGAPPGTIRRFDAGRRPLPASLRGSSSTHAIAVDQAIELGRALGRLPSRLIVYAAEGRSFDAGAVLSDELAAVVPELGEAVLAEAVALTGRAEAHE